MANILMLFQLAILISTQYERFCAHYGMDSTDSSFQHHIKRKILVPEH